MSESPIKQVHYFNRVVLGVEERPITLVDENEFKLSMAQLKEEISEIEEAYELKDMISLLDGLIDLEYYLLGVFYKHGINAHLHDELFTAVHSCNMLKKQGENPKRTGFDGASDAIKPEGWTDPSYLLSRIIESQLK